MTADKNIATNLIFKKDKSMNAKSYSLKYHINSKFSNDIVWKNVMIFMTSHLAAIYGGYLLFTSTKIPTIIFSMFFFNFDLIFNNFNLSKNKIYN